MYIQQSNPYVLNCLMFIYFRCFSDESFWQSFLINSYLFVRRTFYSKSPFVDTSHILSFCNESKWLLLKLLYRNCIFQWKTSQAFFFPAFIQSLFSSFLINTKSVIPDLFQCKIESLCLQLKAHLFA